MPEIIDPVFAKTSQNARFLLSENEHFGHVFVKTGSINLGKKGKNGGPVREGLRSGRYGGGRGGGVARTE